MRSLLITALCLVATTAFAQDGTGLQISASADIVGQAGLQKGSGANDRIGVRGAEIMLGAPADHLFDGTLSFAAHDEGGISHVELHEAWVGSTKLVPRSRFRLGQFFLGVGRLNQFHQHDWPFITAPKVHQTFFAFEGVLDTGGEYSYLLPLPFYLEVTAGVTNGFIFGHDHTAGNRPYMPTHYGRAVTYVPLPGEGGSQIGVTYIGRKDNSDTRMTLLGLDVTAKWREANVLNWFFQGELWYRTTSKPATPDKKELGFYLYPQYYLGVNTYLGLRLDYFSDVTLTDATGANTKNFQLNFVPTISFKPSEFTTFRLAYNHSPEYLRDNFTNTARYLEAQAIFIIGAHPAHDF